MADLNTFRENLRFRVSKFKQDKNRYFQKGYHEAWGRIDFLTTLSSMPSGGTSRARPTSRRMNAM